MAWSLACNCNTVFSGISADCRSQSEFKLQGFCTSLLLLFFFFFLVIINSCTLHILVLPRPVGLVERVLHFFFFLCFRAERIPTWWECSSLMTIGAANTSVMEKALAEVRRTLFFTFL